MSANSAKMLILAGTAALLMAGCAGSPGGPATQDYSFNGREYAPLGGARTPSPGLMDRAEHSATAWQTEEPASEPTYVYRGGRDLRTGRAHIQL
ncbi:MAG: hypothetical protein ACT4N2_01800 [Hyphomicrobium sp.]